MNAHNARRLIPIEPASGKQFTFDGMAIAASARDTIASALIAAGVRTFGTSPHDGTPYGGYCFVGRCSECQVIVNGQPGVVACTARVDTGMVVESQHGLGRWDDEAGS